MSVLLLDPIIMYQLPMDLVLITLNDNKVTSVNSVTRPRLSIAAAASSKVRADLNETADFTITASDQVTTDITVKVNVSETGNFIADGEFTESLSKTVPTTTLEYPNDESSRCFSR